MSTHTIKQALTREAILTLLTDEEIAAVSRDEGTRPLEQGDEYLDLSNLDAGVQAATSGARLEPNNAVARRSVSDATWAKIVRTIDRK